MFKITLRLKNINHLKFYLNRNKIQLAFSNWLLCQRNGFHTFLMKNNCQPHQIRSAKFVNDDY